MLGILRFYKYHTTAKEDEYSKHVQTPKYDDVPKVDLPAGHLKDQSYATR